MLYLHLTEKGHEDAYQLINHVMEDSTMISINEIFRAFGPEYLQRYAHSMPQTHLKAIDAIIQSPYRKP